MNFELGFLLAPALAFIIAAGSPGPATLSVAATSMARGRRAGLAMGAGLSLGLALWGIVAATSLGALILAWAPALVVLRLAGGAFLLWLAWKSARSAWRPAPMPLAPGAAGAQPLGRIFRGGLVLNLLNPKALLAWGAVIALGLPEGARAQDLALIVAVCAGLGAAIYALYAWLFALERVRAAYRRTRRAVDALVAACFGAAGLRLITWRPEAAGGAPG